jgi:starch-binding outer membrane protein, SusD/RagB family
MGCDQLLEVSVPGAAEDSELDNPALARSMVVGALGEFECAWVHASLTNSILTEEFRSANGWRATNIWNSRLAAVNETVGNCSNNRNFDGFGYYAQGQTARFMARDGYDRISGFDPADVPNYDQSLAKLKAYEGYSLTLLGEGYCEMAVDGGPLMSRQDVFALAEQRFTEAMPYAQASGDETILHMANVGRARVRLNQGNLSGAASDAEAVPEGFVRWANYTSNQPRRENRIYNQTYFNDRLTVGSDYVMVELDGAQDPRVPVLDTETTGEDGATRFFLQQKVTSPTQDMPIASWIEAQLIIAEARGGGEAVDAINRIRAYQDLAPYTGDGSLDDVIEERRRQFFLEGHRLNDMLRHNIPFPTGVTNRGDPYGPTTCIPLPEQERLNNPNI